MSLDRKNIIGHYKSFKDVDDNFLNINRPRDVSEQRYHAQLELSSLFDRAFQKKYQQRSIDAYNKFYDEALSLMKSQDIKAFDITQETQETRNTKNLKHEN